MVGYLIQLFQLRDHLITFPDFKSEIWVLGLTVESNIKSDECIKFSDTKSP